MIAPTSPQAGGVQPSQIQNSPQKIEEAPEFQKNELRTEASRESGQPTVPSTSGTPLSAEAITALQQVEDTTVAQDRQDGRGSVDLLNRENIQLDRQQEQNGQAAFNAANEDQEVADQRAELRSEVPVGEETDNAGRSARNPLNLQI